MKVLKVGQIIIRMEIKNTIQTVGTTGFRVASCLLKWDFKR